MERIGPYVVEAELARGGGGVVYRARDPEIGRPVAVKLLQAAGASEVARKRFQREANALGRLRHHGIVPLYDAGEQAGNPYLVMALIEGESLGRQLTRQGPLLEFEAAEVVRDVARALEHAHGQGLLHRDVKPDNVLLDGEGRALLTDFGLVKDLDASISRTQLSVDGMFMGTPGYWSPEQARGRPQEVGPRTDVYGLGATLYALVTGGPPHAGTTLAEFLASAQRLPEPPSRRARGVSPAIDAICLRCLAVDPEERYPSAAAVAEELDRFLAGGDVAAQGERRQALRRRLALVLVGLGLLAGAGAAFLAGARSAGQEQARRIEALLSEAAAGATPAELEASRRKLAAAAALAGDDPAWAERLDAGRRGLEAWEELIEARRAPDRARRVARLRAARQAAGSSPAPALAAALEAQVAGCARALLAEVEARSCLGLLDPDRSRRRAEAADGLARAAAPGGEAARLAARAQTLTAVDVLVARSRAEAPEPLLSALTDLLSELPAAQSALAPRVRLELGLMFGRAGRFDRALRVLQPLFTAEGPEARIACAEALTLQSMSPADTDWVDTRALVDRVLSDPVDDPWRHVARQRKGIQRRDAALQKDAVRALLEGYPMFWFSALTAGDQALTRRDAKAATAAYRRAAELSPRDARVWWWRAATLATALKLARLFLSKQQATALEEARARDLRRLKEAIPKELYAEPAWGNVR